MYLTSYISGFFLDVSTLSFHLTNVYLIVRNSTLFRYIRPQTVESSGSRPLSLR